jgi:aminopeptidase
VTGPDPAAFAGLLCDYCLEVAPGQQVVVRSSTLAAPLLLSLQRQILEREAWPHLRVALPEQEAGFWAAAREAHLDAFAPLDLVEARSTDASLSIHAPSNTRELAGVDPGLLARGARARAPVREVVRIAVADSGGGAAGRDVDRGLRVLRRAGAVPRP